MAQYKVESLSPLGYRVSDSWPTNRRFTKVVAGETDHAFLKATRALPPGPTGRLGLFAKSPWGSAFAFLLKATAEIWRAGLGSLLNATAETARPPPPPRLPRTPRCGAGSGSLLKATAEIWRAGSGSRLKATAETARAGSGSLLKATAEIWRAGSGLLLKATRTLPL
jgi:hypothetical protein